MRPQPSERVVHDSLLLCLDPNFLVDQGRQPGEVLTNEELGSCGAREVLMGIIREGNQSGNRTPIPSFVETGKVVAKLLDDLQIRSIKWQ